MDWLLVQIPFVDVPVILVAGLLAAWILLRNRPTDLGDPAGLDDLVGRGEPVVLNFFGKL